MSINGNAYRAFIESKISIATPAEAVAQMAADEPLYPHQRDAVTWALRRHRALIAMSFGLGKTRIQIAIAKALHAVTGLPFLVVCPLGVKHQFAAEDGPAMGVRWEYVRTDDELRAAAVHTPYLITNYERVRDGGIDPRVHELAGVSLDEGSVLRSLGSKTYQVFQDVFAHVTHRYVCTATPSPNHYRELIYYAQFLGVMDTGQALTRWFKRDPEKAGNLTLHPQHERDFWLWVSSWGLFMHNPADVGYPSAGYELPELRVHWHRIAVDHTRAWKDIDNRGQRNLILNGQAGISVTAHEKRETLGARLAKAQEIIGESAPDTHWLLWHYLEDERRAIEKALPYAVTVYGSQDLETREARILDFSHGSIQVLATKPEIAGSGCNFQRYCHSNIFLGIDYRFEDFIQAVHRTHRFQQPHPVDVHVLYAESEDGIISALKQKWMQHDRLTGTMRDIMQRFGLSHAALAGELARKVGVERREVKGVRFTAVQNDCVDEIRQLSNNSVGLIHTSIPFGNHYEYTTNYEDFGHNPSDAQFFAQMDFLIPELLRVLQPGRCAAIHVKDRQLYGHQTPSGFMSISPFSDQTVAAFMRHGFLYESRRTIVTDVVRENNSTYRLGWSEMCKDASKMSSGLPEYLLLFRKAPSSSAQQYADIPITKLKTVYTRGRWQVDAHSFWRSNGKGLRDIEVLAEMDPAQVAAYFRAEQLAEPYDHERHIQLCEALDRRGYLPSSYMLLPPTVTTDEDDLVWDDIVHMRSLNSQQSQGRERNHICPLPFDIVERTIRLYSNWGDLVVDPFAGLFTVLNRAVKMGRLAYGVELSGEYFGAGVRYCQDAEREVTTPTLFDLAMVEATA